MTPITFSLGLDGAADTWVPDCSNELKARGRTFSRSRVDLALTLKPTPRYGPQVAQCWVFVFGRLPAGALNENLTRIAFHVDVVPGSPLVLLVSKNI